jgi:hypothetical protein
MAYGSESRITLEVVSRENTVGQVTDLLDYVEYSYNLGAVVEVVDQGYLEHQLGQILSVLRSVDHIGVHTACYGLRTALGNDGAQLLFTGFQPTGSSIVSFQGLSNIIDALARVFDPGRRAGQKEDRRHTRVMNKIEEEKAEVDLVSKKVDLVRQVFKTQPAFADEGSNFNQLLRERLGTENAQELKGLLVSEFERASLGAGDLKILEVPKPDSG